MDGTWGSGAAPEEWIAFELMREFGWTWAEYEATPVLVRQFCLDFIMRRRRLQHDAAGSGRDMRDGRAVVRVKR